VEAIYVYQTIRATSYEEIAEQANELGRQGWRLLPPVYQAFDAGTQQRVLLAMMEKLQRLPAPDQCTDTQFERSDFHSPVPLETAETLDFLARAAVRDR
jgi:hypothetical protein